MEFAKFCNFALDQMWLQDPLIPSQIRNHLVSPDSNSPACLVSEMTYTVSSGTLNSTIPYHHPHVWSDYESQQVAQHTSSAENKHNTLVQSW